jgi:hypothetical protein
MIIARSFGTAITIAIASLLGAGCATQTAAFRHMSAEDHERVGAAGGDAADAADHLTAAKDLRRAEEAACFEVPDAERDAGPFARRERIATVEVVRDRLFPKMPEQPVGVAVTIRAAPGLTEQWVGRVIQCHLAHRAVVGARLAEQACPLSADGTRVDLSATHTGFRVTITSKDAAVARSVIARCSALAD